MNLDMRYITEVVAPDRIERWEEGSRKDAGVNVTEDEYRLAKAVLALKASLSEADQRDAARYRWLCENDIHNELFSYGGDKEEIDGAIDAAMRQSAKEGEANG